MNQASKRWSLRLGILSLALMAAAQDVAEMPMPKLEGESLSGHPVILPDAALGKVAVLILGFTKASKVPTSDWGKRISKDFNGQPAFVVYQLPVLEEVPRLIRGMVISGIRKGVPDDMRDHFVPIVNGEAELKKLVNYKEPDDAYLVVLNRSGRIVAQIHGSLADAAYAQLRARLEPLLSGPK
jgi:hypothetical protein